MTCGLVHAIYSLPEWQAVKLTFFAPCKIFVQGDYNQLTCTCATSPTVNKCRMSSSSSVIAPCFKATLERNSSEAFKRSEHQ